MIFSLSQIIENTAKRFPDNEAFRCRGESIRYSELESQSRNLAANLQNYGVKKGDRVAIHMPKCLEMAIAVYGVLKAGGIYVPVDPAMPSERLVDVLNDADVSVILTKEKQSKNLRSVLHQLNNPLQLIVGLDANGKDFCPVASWDEAIKSKLFVEPNILESDPAYIIYTSGSTGQPKGILHTHRSGLSFAALAVETYKVSETDRLGNFAPLHFDQSTFDFFSGPLSGATTVMIPEEHMRFPASLSKLVEDEQLTIWYSVPYALIQMLLRGALETRDLSSLRWVLFGGEAFPSSYLRDLMIQIPDAQFSNIYGPAEVNQCTYYNIPGPPENLNESIPIGKIWKNTEGLIVDEKDLPVPAGEIGELLIRSSTMMSGYWNRDSLNKEVFLEQKGNGTTRRFYRTGDLVQERPDQNLLFHGRKDRQVKIRGNRIELDEIESILLSTNSLIEKAAVLLVEDSESDEKQVLAAIIPRSEALIDIQTLKESLMTKLPSYSLPSEILIVDQFPMTTSDKTDYRILKEQLMTSGVNNGG